MPNHLTIYNQKLYEKRGGWETLLAEENWNIRRVVLLKKSLLIQSLVFACWGWFPAF